MSDDQVFLHCLELLDRGFEHGFGTRRSADAVVVDVATARQVHGNDIVRAPLAGAPVSADALWTTQGGLAVAVRTADCVPILLVDQRGRGVAAVHAGWRGSAARIAEHAVAALGRGIGAEPSDLCAAIGPHIGPCCYEVDGPVLAAISEPSVFRAAARPGHAYLDLLELNRLQLIRAGLFEDSIWSVPVCTFCDERFDSYRRDRGSGRMLHYVRMKHGRS